MRAWRAARISARLCCGLPIRFEAGPGGETVVVIGQPPGQLPIVYRRDLERAWEAARKPSPRPKPRKFRFEPPGEAAFELNIADADALAWVDAVERRIGLSSLYGVSLCLRLLALVALMGSASWARDWFELRREGARIRPELLRAAAMVRLDESGGFDESALQALLPRAEL